MKVLSFLFLLVCLVTQKWEKKDVNQIEKFLILNLELVDAIVSVIYDLLVFYSWLRRGLEGSEKARAPLLNPNPLNNPSLKISQL